MSCGSKSRRESFYYKGHLLDSVSQFKYLELIVQQNGKFNKVIEDQCLKSRRAMYMVKKALGTTGNVSVNLALSLFENQFI